MAKIIVFGLPKTGNGKEPLLKLKEALVSIGNDHNTVYFSDDLTGNELNLQCTCLIFPDPMSNGRRVFKEHIQRTFAEYFKGVRSVRVDVVFFTPYL